MCGICGFYGLNDKNLLKKMSRALKHRGPDDSGYFIDKIKKYKKLILFGIIIISLLSISFQFYTNYNNSYTNTNKCFLEGNKFLEKQKNALVITDESALVYYYTKQSTHFYPNPWSYESLENLIKNHF